LIEESSKPGFKRSIACQQYDISTSCISQILKEKDNILRIASTGNVSEMFTESDTFFTLPKQLNILVTKLADFFQKMLKTSNFCSEKFFCYSDSRRDNDTRFSEHF
jgi:hypothetical protein